jgi:hypothetical protein
MRDASSTLTVEALAEQWRTPSGHAPSYPRFMKILKHLGLSNLQALTSDGRAKIEAELLSRKWTRRDPGAIAMDQAFADAQARSKNDPHGWGFE